MSSVAIPTVARKPVSRSRVVIFVVGCLLAMAFLAWLVLPAKNTSAVSSVAPEFSLASLQGNETVRLSDRGDKPAVINFFAAWCIPCRAELPRFAQAAKQFPDVSFIGVDHQDSRTEAKDLLVASGVAYPSGYDPKGSVAEKYGITAGLPATVFISQSGHVVRTSYGELTQDELVTQLQRLAGEQ